jgi:hypothetical protein
MQWPCKGICRDRCGNCYNLVYPAKKRLSIIDLLRGEAAESISKALRNISVSTIEYGGMDFLAE